MEIITVIIQEHQLPHANQGQDQTVAVQQGLLLLPGMRVEDPVVDQLELAVRVELCLQQWTVVHQVLPAVHQVVHQLQTIRHPTDPHHQVPGQIILPLQADLQVIQDHQGQAIVAAPGAEAAAAGEGDNTALKDIS